MKTIFNLYRSCYATLRSCTVHTRGGLMYTLTFYMDALTVHMYGSNADAAKRQRIFAANIPLKAIERKLVASRVYIGLSMDQIHNIIQSLRIPGAE